MIKNENIFITLQIEKNHETKELVLNVHFDATAPNFSMEREEIHWNPTPDELAFISEAFQLLSSHVPCQPTVEEPQEPIQPTEHEFSQQTHNSEMRITPPEDSVIEVGMNSEQTESMKKAESDEKIFIQADEKKIDEIIKRKKAGFSEEYLIDSGDKPRLDRMLKQKKKKD